MVLVHANADITQYLAKQWAHDNLGTVIGDDNYAPLRVLEGVVTPLATLPLKTTAFRYLSQFSVSDQAESGQANTSTRQVPT